MSAAAAMTLPEPPHGLPPGRPVPRIDGRLPEGACDTHCHVFGPRSAHPLDPKRGYTPWPATLDDYRAVMAAYGIARAVLVQPSVYGFDNSALLDALGRMPDVLRGVAVIAPDAPDAVFEAAHRIGVRGVRINARNPAGLDMADFLPLAQRIAPLGWHIQLQVRVGDVPDLAAIAARSGVPVVVDHFGLPDLALGPRASAFGGLVALAAAGGCMVKLSAPYRLAMPDGVGDALAPFVRRLVDEAPDALLWALDWPHTECFADVPDDGLLIDGVFGWLPTEAMRRRILCDNPRRLYWADGAAAASDRMVGLDR